MNIFLQLEQVGVLGCRLGPCVHCWLVFFESAVVIICLFTFVTFS